jgi:hypothetical protein
MTRKASIALITPVAGSANRLAAVVYALNQSQIDWQESELAIFVLAEGNDGVTLPPGDWHLLDGSHVEGGHVFTRDEIGDATVAFSALWNPTTGT